MDLQVNMLVKSNRQDDARGSEDATTAVRAKMRPCLGDPTRRNSLTCDCGFLGATREVKFNVYM